MTSTDPWDDFEPTSDGQFVRFDTPGQTIVGTIVRRESGTNFDGDPVPQLVLDTDDGTQIVTGSTVNLRQQMLAHRDDLIPGARIRLTYTGVGVAKPGKAAPKLFTLEVKAGDPPAPAKKAKAAPAPAAPAADPDDF